MVTVPAKSKIYEHLRHFFIVIFILLFSLQFFFWLKAEKIKPDVNIVPKLPSAQAVAAFSFGDSQFYFRVNALRIENAGDSFGRFTPLKQYDYEELYKWFKLLDGLDSKSKYVPTLAANYYSQTQNKEDTRYVIQYLDEYASRDIDENWWWMFQAVYIANTTLKDNELALKLAYKLSENNNVRAPIWTKQFPAFIEAKMGEDCKAFIIINKILKDSEGRENEIPAKEMDFMRYFIKERLENLKKKNFDPSQCKEILDKNVSRKNN